VAKPVDDSTPRPFERSSSHTGGGIVIDLGTGDGTFVYQSAKENPDRFYIGIDANPKPLEKISEKIHRKPAKGGLPNVMFVQAAVEDLPGELEGVADEVHVHFPWGSLLHAVVTGDHVFLRSVQAICTPGALLEVIAGLDPERDRGEIERLGLPPFSTAYIDTDLAPRYAEAGFEIIERGVLSEPEWAGLKTSWAKRLRGGTRTVMYLVASGN
jgi:16S rRNA (adenine(1408)-N(1))-methyltransferase